MAEVESFRAEHPDLYRTQGGKVRLAISGGAIALDSINAARGLGSDALPDSSSMERMA
jgi:hypothetical protein